MTCPACTAAAASPDSGPAIDGCRACWVRRVAAMPTSQRREIYHATPADEVGQLQADVKAEYDRISEARARAKVAAAWGMR